MALLVLTSTYRSTQQIREESNQVRDQAQQFRGKASAIGCSEAQAPREDD